MPATGPMTLKGSGTLAAFSVRKPGVYTIKVPRGFLATAHATAFFGTFDAPSTAAWLRVQRRGSAP